MLSNSIHKLLAAYGLVALTAASTALAAPGMYQDIVSFTYDFGKWNNRELQWIKPQKGGCSFVLQAFDKPEKSDMVFPYCYPGHQAPTPDIEALGATIFDRFIYTASARQNSDVRFNHVDAEKKIGPNIFILDDLQPVEGDECSLRAGTISQLTMGSTLSSDANRVPTYKNVDISKLPTYPNPACYDLNKYVYGRDGKRRLA